MRTGTLAKEDAVRRASRSARSFRMPRFVLALPDGRYIQRRDMGSPRLGDGVTLVAVANEDGSVAYETVEVAK